MRQILIIKGRDENILVVNLPEDNTYSISFTKSKIDDDMCLGSLSISYATKRLRITMKFRNDNDMLEFEESLLKYLQDAAIPTVSENDKVEFRYWMEIDVLEVQDVYIWFW